MSIDYINAVFSSDLEPYDRLVMLALADRADDETGACYPSIQDICDRTGMGERGVQNVIKRLIAGGHLAVKWGGGRHQRNTYTLALNPAPDAPYLDKPRTRNTAPDAGISSETPHAITETPHAITLNPAPDAGEPSITIIEPSSNKISDVSEVLGRWASEPAVKSFIAYRKGHKAKALTKTAATRLAANLQKIFNEGGDADDALGLAEERGWASVEPDWYFKAKGNGNGTGNPNINGAYQRRPGGPNDSMVAAFAFVADRHSHRS